MKCIVVEHRMPYAALLQAPCAPVGSLGGKGPLALGAASFAVPLHAPRCMSPLQLLPLQVLDRMLQKLKAKGHRVVL
jgi:hypothetical protein